jgi:hypothetical protein
MLEHYLNLAVAAVSLNRSEARRASTGAGLPTAAAYVAAEAAAGRRTAAAAPAAVVWIVRAVAAVSIVWRSAAAPTAARAGVYAGQTVSGGSATTSLPTSVVSTITADIERTCGSIRPSTIAAAAAAGRMYAGAHPRSAVLSRALGTGSAAAAIGISETAVKNDISD